MSCLQKLPIKIGLKELSRLIFFALLFFIFFKLNIFSKLQGLSEPYDFDYWEEKYNKSGWRDPYSKEGIGDDALYVYQGISILRGQDPSLLNPEICPLGKYILGEITLLFHNRFIVSFIFYFLSLVTCFLLVYKISKKKLLSFLLSLLIFSEPVIVSQLAASSIDLVLLFFFLGFILSADFYLSESFFKKLIPTIFLGLFIGVKSYFLGIIIVISLLTASIFSKHKEGLKSVAFHLIPSFFIYCLSFLPYFLQGHTFFEFLKLHRWVVWFYSNKLEKIFYGGGIWLIMFNRWQTWFGKWYGLYDFIRIEEWWILWPILLIIFLNLIYMVLSKKKNLSQENFTYCLIFFWTIFYFLFLNVVPLWSRYLLLFLPPCYILVAKTFLDLKLKAIPLKAVFVLGINTLLIWLLFGRLNGVNSFLAEIALTSRNFVFSYGLSNSNLFKIILGIVFFPAYIIGNGQLQFFIFYFYWLTSFIFTLFFFFRKMKRVKFALLALLILNSLFFINYQFKSKIKLSELLEMMEEPYKISKGEYFTYEVLPQEQDSLINYLFEDYGYKKWDYRPRDGQVAVRKKHYQFCLIKTKDCPKIEKEGLKFLFERVYDSGLQLRGYEYEEVVN